MIKITSILLSVAFSASRQGGQGDAADVAPGRPLRIAGSIEGQRADGYAAARVVDRAGARTRVGADQTRTEAHMTFPLPGDEQLQALGLDAAATRPPTSDQRFPDGGAWRIEIPSVEGPEPLRRSSTRPPGSMSTTYLYVSFDRCCAEERSDYRVMVGRATEPTGPYVDRYGTPMMDGGGTEILAGHDALNGPGHQAVLADTDGDILFYHYYPDSGEGPTGCGYCTLGINRIGYDADTAWPSLS